MRLQETERIEFKRSVNERICKTIIAFANGTGGEIYVGIDDFGNVLDLEDIDGDMLKISNYVHDLICPELLQFVHIEPIELEGKRIIRVMVEAGDEKPYYLAAKGLVPAGIYTRLGPATVPMSRRDIRRLIRETDFDSFDSRHAKVQNLSFDYATQFFKQRNVTFDTEHYRALGMISSDGFFSNLALLISDQNPYTLKCAIFNDDAGTEFLRRRECEGSILRQFSDALEFLRLANSQRSYFPSHTRVDQFDYPDDALREGLLNAIIHRDYDESSYRPTLVKMYRTELVFVSCGCLNHISAERAITHESSPRNPLLLALFHRLDEVEAYGSGLPMIWKLYQAEKLKPTLEGDRYSVILTLPNINTAHNPYLSQTRNDGPNLRGGHEAFDQLNAMGALPARVKQEYDRERARRAEALQFQQARREAEARGMNACDAFQHALEVTAPSYYSKESDHHASRDGGESNVASANQLPDANRPAVPRVRITSLERVDEKAYEGDGTKNSTLMKGKGAAAMATAMSVDDRSGQQRTVEHFLIEFAFEHDGFSRGEAQEVLGLGRDTTLKVINGLVQDGKLRKVGRARATRYQAVG